MLDDHRKSHELSGCIVQEPVLLCALEFCLYRLPVIALHGRIGIDTLFRVHTIRQYISPSIY